MAPLLSICMESKKRTAKGKPLSWQLDNINSPIFWISDGFIWVEKGEKGVLFEEKKIKDILAIKGIDKK